MSLNWHILRDKGSYYLVMFPMFRTHILLHHEKTTNQQSMETKQAAINKSETRIWKRQKWVPPPSRCEDDRLKVFVKLTAAKSAKGETPRGHVCSFIILGLDEGDLRMVERGGGGDVVNSPMKLAQHFDGQPAPFCIPWLSE